MSSTYELTMKLFQCQSCGHPLYFENTHCERCHHQTGYLPDIEVVTAVEPDGDKWIALADPDKRYRFCSNWERLACNWMVEADATRRCAAPASTTAPFPTFPIPARYALWRRMEEAKRRLIYSLIKLKLPTPSLASGDQEPLVFDFLADAPNARKDHYRPRRRDHHDLARRGRRRRTRKAAHRAARAVPHAARPLPPRGRPLLLGPAGARRRTARGLPRRVRRRDAPTTTKRCSATTRTARRRTGGKASFPPTRPCIRGRTSPRPGRTTCTSSTRSRWRTRSISVAPRVAADEGLSAVVDRNPYRAPNVETAARRVAAAHLRGQQPQPQHGPARSLSLRHLDAGGRQAAVHPRPHSQTAQGAERRFPRLAPPPKRASNAPRFPTEKLSAAARRRLGVGEENDAATQPVDKRQTARRGQGGECHELLLRTWLSSPSSIRTISSTPVLARSATSTTPTLCAGPNARTLGTGCGAEKVPLTATSNDGRPRCHRRHGRN